MTDYKPALTLEKINNAEGVERWNLRTSAFSVFPQVPR